MDLHRDFLIVGQGIAGSCLSFALNHLHGKSVMVVDEKSGAECSRKAAGTFNPVVFRTFTSVWRADEFIPFLKEFYGRMASAYDRDLINEKNILKMFKSADQRNLWTKKTEDGPAAKFMKNEVVEKPGGLNSPFGFGEVMGSGNISIKELLDAQRSALLEQGSLLKEHFDFEEFRIGDEGVCYKNKWYGAVVFCQGHEGNTNPLFSDLPFRSTKGEGLIIRARNLSSEFIYHNKVNLIPLGNDLFWVGSTFDWDDLSTNLTQSAKSRLMESINELLDVQYEVVDQFAGIRPTVKDRRPLIGGHPKHNNVYVFNGLGTRGVMLAPFFAKQLCEHILNGKVLDPEVSIDRFTE